MGTKEATGTWQCKSEEEKQLAKHSSFIPTSFLYRPITSIKLYGSYWAQLPKSISLIKSLRKRKIC